MQILIFLLRQGQKSIWNVHQGVESIMTSLMWHYNPDENLFQCFFNCHYFQKKKEKQKECFEKIY